MGSIVAGRHVIAVIRVALVVINMSAVISITRLLHVSVVSVLLWGVIRGLWSGVVWRWGLLTGLRRGMITWHIILLLIGRFMIGSRSIIPWWLSHATAMLWLGLLRLWLHWCVTWQ